MNDKVLPAGLMMLIVIVVIVFAVLCPVKSRTDLEEGQNLYRKEVDAIVTHVKPSTVIGGKVTVTSPATATLTYDFVNTTITTPRYHKGETVRCYLYMKGNPETKEIFDMWLVPLQ